MGACTFTHTAKGKTAQEAFNSATDDARYEHGHGGYTGTIAEKSEFKIIPVPAEIKAMTVDNERKIAIMEIADKMIEDGDPRVDDKWGPAGCLDLGDGEFLFFGWASE